jgi:hypothetical protein
MGIVQDRGALLRLSKPHAEVSGYLRKRRKAENMMATMEKHPPLPMTMCSGRMQDAEDAMRSSRERRQSRVEGTGCRKTSDLDWVKP